MSKHNLHLFNMETMWDYIFLCNVSTITQKYDGGDTQTRLPFIMQRESDSHFIWHNHKAYI